MKKLFINCGKEFFPLYLITGKTLKFISTDFEESYVKNRFTDKVEIFHREFKV
jgi:hypothetical protein